MRTSCLRPTNRQASRLQGILVDSGGESPRTLAGDESPAELIRALAIFAEPPSAEHDAVAQALDFGDAPGGDEYAQLFSFQLYPYAAVHLGPEGMMGGDAADRVAGFWRAVGHVPPSEPDHLSALLGLYASLLEAEGQTDGAERKLVAQSRAALLHEHLAPWVFAFLARVEALGGAFHRNWAAVLSAVLAQELRRDPVVAALPLHLREAPGLPDPREEGGGAFLDGLLAPVRTGMILARADLVRMARSLELGVRIGERRYILEHLLGQDPARTLKALAGEAEAWGEHHARWAPQLGSAGSFWVGRAASTAALLSDLADLAEVGDEALGLVAEATP